ncbi:MAG: metal ABC transporter solute-binding protein, Zn/Mn family [Desulfosalsimonas sp.]
MKKACCTAALALILAAAAVMPAKAEKGGEKLNVFVSIPPQKHFVEQIAGDGVSIKVMVSPGAHPATYEPTARQMAALSECDLYFAVGVPFEKAWMKKIVGANPDIRVVRTDAWIEKQPVERGSHNHNGHDHGTADPHTWLSPPLVMVQARHILTALTAADPENADSYNSRYKDFISKTAELDEKLRSLFPAGEKKPEFMVFHPAWGYFADAYGLKQTAVETEGKSPKAAEISRIVEHARKKDIGTVLVQPQISERTAEMIASEIRGELVKADPLAENWQENLLEVAEIISRASR